MWNIMCQIKSCCFNLFTFKSCPIPFSIFSVLCYDLQELYLTETLNIWPSFNRGLPCKELTRTVRANYGYNNLVHTLTTLVMNFVPCLFFFLVLCLFVYLFACWVCSKRNWKKIWLFWRNALCVYST